MATVIDSYNESNQSTSVSVSGSNFPAAGQTFELDSGRTLYSAKFYLKKTGSPTGNATVKIYAHTGTFGTSGVPTGSALATSNTLDVSTLTTSYQLIEQLFSGVENLSSGQYCLSFEYSGGDGSNRVDLAADSSSPTHEGNGFNKFGSSWNSSANDRIFYLLVAEESSASASQSPSLSPSASSSLSPSASASPSPSVSVSLSPSLSLSPSVSVSLSPSASQSPSASVSPSVSVSLSPSLSQSPSVSVSLSPSVSQSGSGSLSPSRSSSLSASPSASEETLSVDFVCLEFLILYDNVYTAANRTYTNTYTAASRTYTDKYTTKTDEC